MHAAVVTEFGHAPHYLDVDEPVAADGREVVDVVAVALHPRVRSQAAGSHYTSGAFEGGEELPLIPGIDGVGRRSDGSLRYFVLPDTRFGSMAERVAIDVRRSIRIADDADPIAIAAAMNPAMSSWVALRRRAQLEPGQSVLVLGATGSAGQLAVQIAKRLGASRVVAGERNDRVGAEVDVVIDYLWGRPAQLVMPRLVTARSDRGRLLTWVQVGAITGAEIALPSALLRQANLRLMGSGQGSVSTHGILEELVPLVAEIQSGAFTLDTEIRRLADVESVWNEPRDARRRTVFTAG